MKLIELADKDSTFKAGEKNDDATIKFWYLQATAIKGGQMKEVQLTFDANYIGLSNGYKEGQDVVLLEVGDDIAEAFANIEEDFRENFLTDSSVKIYDYVFNSEIKIKLQKSDDGEKYKERGSFTPTTLAALGYHSLVTVTASVGWYLGDHGQGLFLKVRDFRSVTLKRTRK